MNKPEINHVIQELADELRVSASFIEKDWYSMQVLGVLSELEHPSLELVFSGGTSLSKGFGLIQRFSEDLDFKVSMSEGSTRSQRKAFRNLVLEILEQHGEGWQPDLENVMAGNNSKFFRVPILYPAEFDVSESLRPYIQLEVSFEEPAIAPEARPLQSFVAQALNQGPESPSFPCISPVETAANKLSALTWRVLSRDRESERDDPTLVRHLHDLAVLKETVKSSDMFPKLVLESLSKDVNRAQYEQSSETPQVQLQALLKTLKTDEAYQGEYQKFVLEMSYAEEETRPTYEGSVSSVGELIELVSTQEKQNTRILSGKEFNVVQSVLDAYALENPQAMAQLLANQEMTVEEAETLFKDLGLDAHQYGHDVEQQTEEDEL